MCAKRVAVLLVPAPHDERGIDAAKAERVRQSDIERVRDRFVGYIIESALGIGILEIHGGRELLVHQGEHGDAGFKSARAAEKMAGHRFRSADLEAVA